MEPIQFIAASVGVIVFIAFLIMRKWILNRADLLYNHRELDIYERTINLVMQQLDENTPREQRISLLNAVVDTYNEQLKGKSAEQMKHPHFQLSYEIQRTENRGRSGSTGQDTARKEPNPPTRSAMEDT